VPAWTSDAVRGRRRWRRFARLTCGVLWPRRRHAARRRRARRRRSRRGAASSVSTSRAKYLERNPAHVLYTPRKREPLPDPHGTRDKPYWRLARKARNAKATAPAKVSAAPATWLACVPETTIPIATSSKRPARVRRWTLLAAGLVGSFMRSSLASGVGDPTAGEAEPRSDPSLGRPPAGRCAGDNKRFTEVRASPTRRRLTLAVYPLPATSAP